MSGCRMVWIDDTGNPPIAGSLAKAAYRRLGKWAFEKNSKWTGFITAQETDRLDYLATALKASFAGSTPSGAPNANPRVLIVHQDSIPSQLTDTNVTNYHKQHSLKILDDGDNYCYMIFKGDPLQIDFASYYGDYGTDEGEPINVGRAQRTFAMALMTRCR